MIHLILSLRSYMTFGISTCNGTLAIVLYKVLIIQIESKILLSLL